MKKILTFVLALVLTIGMSVPAWSASYSDSNWSFWEQNVLYIGDGGGTSEPNDIYVRMDCHTNHTGPPYYHDHKFRIRVQYRAYWNWWNDEDTRYLRCGQSTTYWNPTSNTHDDYRVLVYRYDSGGGDMWARAVSYWR